ncbi:MAG: hypothetical protein Harvfovirus28_4 [Harvfovirus sp.]|uniref:Uncharacterized protein n=1 Tax=Harvfovirus sp. TaxID=2487768 RepID=A0A3G5A7B2_9VIRU|nr:MAG: hypothetical protein Harvfovirus28_4 [Harvfovirus sp.]
MPWENSEFLIFNNSTYNISIFDKINGVINHLFPDDYYFAPRACYLTIINDYTTHEGDLPSDYSIYDELLIENSRIPISHHYPIKSVIISNLV